MKIISDNKTSFVKITFLILQIFLCAEIRSQNINPVDSLTKIILNSNDEHEVASTYVELGKAFLQSDVKKAIMYYDKAITLGHKNNDIKIVGDAFNNKGFAFINLGEKQNATSSLDSSKYYHSQIGNKEGIAAVDANYGNLYYTFGDFTKSLQFHLLSLRSREQLKDTAGQGREYNNIGVLYMAQKRFDKAYECYKKSLDIAQQSHDKTSECIALGNLGTVLLRLNKMDEAYSAYAKLFSVSQSLGNKDGQAISYLGFAKIHEKKYELNEALANALKGEVIAVEIGNSYRTNELRRKIGGIYYNMKNYEKALEYFFMFYQDSKKMNMKDSELDGLHLISDTYAALKNTDKAYEYLALYSKMSDTLNIKENQKQIAELQTRFETEKKQQENEFLSTKLKVKELELNTNRYLLTGLVILFAFSILITILVIRQNKLRAEQSTLIMKQKLLRSQMNPHFIFNSLTTIESFVYENQPKEAGKYLSDFARLMRLILENSSEEYIPLSKEIKTLEYYFVLQKLRLENKLTYRIITDGIEEIDNTNIPPMLTQPFIENAIEHGFRSSSKEGIIEVEFKNINNEQLQIRVKDNGKGIDNGVMLTNNDKHKSMAINITKERLLVLNKSKKQKVTFVISDISDPSNMQTGTEVLFTIPLV